MLPETTATRLLSESTSQEPAADDALTPEELSEVLAEATGTTADDIERGVEELDIAPPEEATVVESADEWGVLYIPEPQELVESFTRARGGLVTKGSEPQL